MAPRIDQPLKREVELQGQLYIVTITSEGVSIVPKGKRSGARQMTWLELVSGEAELERGSSKGTGLGICELTGTRRPSKTAPQAGETPGGQAKRIMRTPAHLTGK